MPRLRRTILHALTLTPLLYSAALAADEPPRWAYPSAPPGESGAAPPDMDAVHRVPNSKFAFTRK
jgi:hypothetical protein